MILPQSNNKNSRKYLQYFQNIINAVMNSIYLRTLRKEIYEVYARKCPLLRH